MKNRSLALTKMKLLLISGLFILFTDLTYSQTFIASFPNGFTKIELPGNGISLMGTLRNATSNTLVLDVVRLKNDTAPGWESAFSFDICFSPLIDSGRITIGPNRTIDCDVYFSTSLTPDTSYVKIKVKNVNNPSESVIYDFTGITSTNAGIAGYSLRNKTVSISPNPFTQSALVSLKNGEQGQVQHPAEFLLYDILGNEVRKVSDISQDHFILEREGLPAGIYTYKIRRGGDKLAAGKIIIN